MIEEQDTFAAIEHIEGAILTGHFVLSSGKHSDRYVQKERIFYDTTVTSMVCLFLAEHYMSANVDVVVGPDTGGRIVAYQVAAHLNNLPSPSRRKVVAVYAKKKEDNVFYFPENGTKLLSGKRVLVVDDVLTSGESVKKVVELVRAHTGFTVGVGAIWNRGGVGKEHVGNVPILAIINKQFSSWSEEECRYSGPCSKGISVDSEIGHG